MVIGGNGGIDAAIVLAIVYLRFMFKGGCGLLSDVLVSWGGGYDDGFTMGLAD